MNLPLPNLVIAGVTKAGTTSLFGYLGQHPDIAASDEKELDHYAPLITGEECPPLTNYAAHFAHAALAPVRMEASPRYFIGGRRIARRLADDLGAAGRRPKVVIALRDPVARMWSSYNYKRSKRRLDPSIDFAEYIERSKRVYEQGLIRDPQHQAYRALGVGVYADHLGEWIDELGDDLRIIFFEHLREPVGELQSLCAWLGVDSEPVAGFDLSVRNATYQPRSEVLRRAASGASRTSSAVLAPDSRTRSLLRSAYRKINARDVREVMSEADRAALHAFYDPTLPRLRRMLREHGTTRLPAWLA